MATHPDQKASRPWGSRPWGRWLLLLPVFYLLSSGPLLGLCFWLRETTGWDGWYGVMWLYWPILEKIHENAFLGSYVTWWVVDVFHTVGPG